MLQLFNHDFFVDPTFPFHIGAYNSIIEEHTHEFFELVFVDSGYGNHIYKNHSFPIVAGDVFLIEPNVSHTYVLAEGSGPLCIYNLLMDASLIKKEISDLSQISHFNRFFYFEPFLRSHDNFEYHLRLSAGERIKLKVILDEITKEYNEKGTGHQIIIKTQLIGMLVYLSRCYEHIKLQPVVQKNENSSTIDQIISFVQLHYAKSFSIDEVTRLTGMSRSSFAHYFKKYTGKTFIQFRNDLRLQMAKEMIENSDRRILDISQHVGFDDLSHFNKLFYDKYRCTPTSFRKKKRCASFAKDARFLVE